MFGLGVQELLLILLIALFFFGGKQLPEIAKGLGKGLREFKRASEGGADDEDEHAEPKKQTVSHGGAAGPGEQGEHEGLPQNRRGTGQV
jgi:sec-independent protein translocase protein TatA